MTTTDIEELLAQLRTSLRRELLASGWNDKTIRRALADRSLVRARYGAYVDGAAWSALDAVAQHELVVRSVVARSGTEVVASHSSALAHWRAPEWGLGLDTVHLTRRDQRAGRAAAGVRQHRGVLLPEDVHTVRGTPVTSPERALFELATIADTETSLVHANDLLHRELVTPQSLRARYEKGIERWPGSFGTDLVLRLADGRCESVAETRFFYLCWRFGLPAPTPQLKVVKKNGVLVARLDFCWPELKAWVEVDGMQKYVKFLRPGETVTEVVMREKKREDAVRRLTDMRCMRVTWPDLERPAQTAVDLRHFLYPAAASPQAALVA